MTEQTNSDKVGIEDVLPMTVDIVASYLAQNQIPASEIASLINTVHESLMGLNSTESNNAKASTKKPAVSIKKSITPDYIICLEDGRKLKMLKRHLRTAYNLTPDEYRSKWRLPSDYPMVAPNYAKKRSAFAKQIGLGRTGKK